METLRSAPEIDFAANACGLSGYTGEFVPLGGGEVNDTYLLDYGSRKNILRIARHEGQQTLKAEANALRLLEGVGRIPTLIFYDDTSLINGRQWIMESQVQGKISERLTPVQFTNLGKVLAQVHKQHLPNAVGVNARERFLDSCKAFGNEAILLNHPDIMLSQLINKGYQYFDEFQPKLDQVIPTLIHSDATPSNILVDGNEVGLIDWEFAKYSDPMAEFSTVFYEDMEYNKGKWRIQITDTERSALYEGYSSGDGVIDEERVKFWMTHDKLGAAVFLYWRINQSGISTADQQMEQYKLDLSNIQQSLLEILS